MSAAEVYNEAVKPLPLRERLELARLILNDIVPESVSSYAGEWTEEDLRDFSTATWAHIDRALEEDTEGA